MAHRNKAILLLLAVLGIVCGQLVTTTSNQVFSTVANTPQTKNIVFTNLGSFTVTVSTITFEGPDVALFTSTPPTLPAAVAQGATLSIPVVFAPTSSGLKQAVMILTNSLGSKTYVYLSGVAAAGLGGITEPSLQYILAANRIPVYVGDSDPSDNIIAATAEAQNTAILGDEIKAQYFEKINANEPVSFEVLAVYGPTGNDPVVTVGYYNPIGSANSGRTPVVSVSNTPTNNGQTCNPVVSGTPSFDPAQTTFGIYTLWPYFQDRVVYSEDALNTWDDGKHHLRVYRYKDQNGVTMNDTLILAFEEDTTNKDFNDIVIVARNIRVGSALKVVNTEVPRDANGALLPGWRDDLFTGFKIMTGENLFILRRHFGNPFVLTNQGSTPLTITAMDLSAPTDWAFYPEPTLPLTLAAGTSMDMNVTFIKPSGTKGLYSSTLTITCNDPNQATRLIYLEGLFMDYPEDVNELPLKVIQNGFGFHLDINNPSLQMTIDGKYGSPLNGEEVRSRLWQLADAALPLNCRKTAAFRQCCNDSGITEIQDAGGAKLATLVDSNLWSQTILPAAWGEASYLTNLVYKPTVNFALVSGLGGPWTSWSTNTFGPQQGVKTWVLRDQWSEIIPNAYVLGQDFIWDGCGNGGNCDYQDNINIFNNIKPTTQDGVDQRAKDKSYFVPMGDASTVISWATPTAPYTVKDSAGVATGFISAFSSGADADVLKGSYQPAQITVTGNALNVVAQPGSFMGTADSQVNALLVRFDGRNMPFTVSANLRNLGDINAGQEMAGIFLGSNKKAFATVYYAADGTVKFYAEVDDAGTTVGSAAVTAGMTNLRLILVGDYRTNAITAMYEAYYAGSFSSGTLGTYTVAENMRGYFFSKPSEAGIMTSSSGGAPFTVTYDDFAVTPGVSAFYMNELPTFTYDFIPTGVASSTTAETSSTSGSSTSASDSNTPTGTSQTGTGSQTVTETGPESCGDTSLTTPTTDESTATQTQSTRPTGGETTTSNPTATAPRQGSDASAFAPLAVFLIVAIALTM